ncbi:alpha-E domain-containing protein [Sabulicella rubraurantiaca]|uniref:alpha-E domain-containing protein n=1 Tax=Sabulicella rubraurantiaca TaxID=2811429 RepID=UPI001A96F6A7|nr:alpha-E domain-containing protein [Sabulicella rubraurantiaca]
MLSRAADSLFWLGRYTERAANVARGLNVAWRLDGLGTGEDWHRILVASGCEPGFMEKHGKVTPEAVVDFLVRDPDNPSGILSCFAAARSNARQVRTALTVDMWSGLNESWAQFRNSAPEDFQGERLPEFLDRVRERVLLFNGAAQDTMLRGEAFLFVQLGTALERADNTARILDVKHDMLKPGSNGTVEFAQWQAILQSVSALRAYHWIFRERLDPARIAELLILRPELPRSLVACHSRVTEVLEMIAAGQGGRRGECHRLSGEITASLRYGKLSDILEGGLHDWLTRMIGRTAQLGGAIEEFYIQGG